MEPFFLPPAAFPLQSCGAAGVSLRPRPEPPAGSQLCQWRPTAQSCSDALAQLRWTPFPLKVPAGTQQRGKSCIVGERCECKQTNKKGSLCAAVCVQIYLYFVDIMQNNFPLFLPFQSSLSLFCCLREKLIETCRKQGRILESRPNKPEQGHKATPGSSFRGRSAGW